MQMIQMAAEGSAKNKIRGIALSAVLIGIIFLGVVFAKFHAIVGVIYLAALLMMAYYITFPEKRRMLTIGIKVIAIIFFVVLYLLMLLGIYLNPLDFGIYGLDVTPAVCWLVDQQLPVSGFAISLLFYYWLAYRENRKDEAERRLS